MKLLLSATSWRLGLLLPAALIAATLPAPGQAQDLNPISASLSQADGATYADKLSQGRAVQGALEGCIRDIEQNDLRLTEENRRLEYELGLLRTRENKLRPEIASASEEAGRSYTEAEEARNEVRVADSIRANLRQYRVEIQRAVDQCKREHNIFQFACDWAKELSGLRAKEDKLNADIAEIDRRIQIKQADMQAAENRLNEASQRMDVLQAQITQVDAQIGQIEPQIVLNKSVLASARQNFQVARNTVDDLDGLLGEVEAAGAGLQPVTRTRLNNLSASIDELVGSTPQILADGRGVLPPDRPGCVGF